MSANGERDDRALERAEAEAIEWAAEQGLTALIIECAGWMRRLGQRYAVLGSLYRTCRPARA